MQKEVIMKRFIDCLKGMDRTKDTYTNFSNFIELTYCAYAKPTATLERGEDLEKRYMAIVGQYDKLIIRTDMMELAKLTVEGVMAGGNFLGDAFQQLELQNKDAGQFFTPFALSRLSAELVFTGYEHIIEEKGFVTLSEPTCGGGSMILACADILQEKGFKLHHNLWVEAIDLADLPFKMCFIQLCMRGIPAQVFRGNTITLETFEAASTWAVNAFLLKNGNPFPARSTAERSEPEIIPAAVKKTAGQLTLF